MFGQYYVKRDAQLKAQELTQEDYARELLEEILNRAIPLEALLMGSLEADNPADQREKLEQLAATVEMFLRDLDEVRTRGARARLFALSNYGTVTAGSVAIGDLAEVGGSLVPWHEDDEMSSRQRPSRVAK